MMLRHVKLHFAQAIFQLFRVGLFAMAYISLLQWTTFAPILTKH